MNDLGDFNINTGTERADYEFCVIPQGSAARNINGSILYFAKFRGLRIAGWNSSFAARLGSMLVV